MEWTVHFALLFWNSQIFTRNNLRTTEYMKYLKEFKFCIVQFLDHFLDKVYSRPVSLSLGIKIESLDILKKVLVLKSTIY